MNKLSTIKKSKNNRIFLVDNEFDNTLVFEMALKDNGFIVDTFNESLLALSNFKLICMTLLFLTSIFQRWMAMNYTERDKKNR